MSRVDLDRVLAGLKRFQQDTVAHIAEKFYGTNSHTHSGRFLVADETGLGKSVVARGVIAKTIRALEADPEVHRINIVYICSNQDLASQNLKRLNVTEEEHIARATRLTLLVTQAAAQPNTEHEGHNGTPINLVSFTPGTSFSARSMREGNAAERALLAVFLNRILAHDGAQAEHLFALFQGGVHTLTRFIQRARDLERQLHQGFNTGILHGFHYSAEQSGLLTRVRELRDRLATGETVRDMEEEKRQLVSELRECLASVSLESLEPHLVILDEFQRFKTLLDPHTGGSAAELAGKLFSYQRAKVLLLSATPYHPFTEGDDGGDSHYNDFFQTIEFLVNGEHTRVSEIKQAFRAYRETLYTGASTEEPAAHVRTLLTDIMTRSERPNMVGEEQQINVRRLAIEAPTVDDLTEWLNISQLGERVNAPINAEYWKSIPYLMNFIDGYQWGNKIHEQLGTGQSTSFNTLIRKSRRIRNETVKRKKKIDAANGRLRALMQETLEQGWWKLLWVPPSMPYLEPGPVYAPFSDHSVTKHVIFSSWAATPKAIATVMSHEADRLMRGIRARGLASQERETGSQRLTYTRREGTYAHGLSTLALFWPHPGLLKYADQLGAAKTHGGRVSSKLLLEEIRIQLPDGDEVSEVWEAFFAHAGAFDASTTDTRFAIEFEYEGGRHTQPSEPAQHAVRKGLRANIEYAQQYAAEYQHETRVHPGLASIIAFSPGSVAYRAVAAIAGENTTSKGVWQAAFVIAEALRTLFNRPESQTLLDQLATPTEAEEPYWQKVLNYCADGNLRAVLDEYLFQLWCETGQAPINDETLTTFAYTVARSLGMRHATYKLHDPLPGSEQPRITTRFAVPYVQGAAAGVADSSAARQSSVREAFNSPFAPFVLTSTSIGQEGVDFHWWSHSVIHWNMPSNPVDFEQREGRVNRFGGLAVRRNVADAHWSDVLAVQESHAWNVAFNAAQTATPPEDDFAPWWVYPGPTQIQRVLMHYPMSRDIERYERLRSALSFYRLTLGQPRQEDMLELIQRQSAGNAPTTIDLSPPRVTHQ